MKQFYMVEFELLDVFTNDFLNKIPQQQQQIDRMMAKGIIKSYSLSLNRSKLWLIAGAENEFEVMEIIAQLSLSEFMIPSIMPLMFHNSSQTVREFSLN
ncbi:hypothetical protein [Aureispira anguillae]|uniref:Muconolactone isomerase domain-containing protein n=1 Tax=Aureispira anguillae TaxID=2864201 RepID=A0A915YCG2_9BACT|nr:hypothetical protein [Aureispira anguillae]BDS10498.1 hypothetical protein AsAng_0012060 [Aureispira anguillae]